MDDFPTISPLVNDRGLLRLMRAGYVSDRFHVLGEFYFEVMSDDSRRVIDKDSEPALYREAVETEHKFKTLYARFRERCGEDLRKLEAYVDGRDFSHPHRMPPEFHRRSMQYMREFVADMYGEAAAAWPGCPPFRRGEIPTYDLVGFVQRALEAQYSSPGFAVAAE